jgi:hypothetical protein
VSQRKSILWLKRILVVAAVVMIVIIAGGAYLLRRVPAWYARVDLTPERRAELAQHAENQLIRLHEYAAAQLTGGNTTNAAALAPIEVTFSQEEVNSLIEKWGGRNGWQSSYTSIVKDPAIIFQKDRIILAGLSQEMGTVVSLHFAPSIDNKGVMHINLMRVLGGNLPMPESVYGGYRDRMLAGLQRKIIGWRNGAVLRPDGSTNDKAVVVNFAHLFIAAMTSQPTDAVLFLPISSSNGASVPVKVTKIDVADGTLTMTICPLTPVERQATFQHLKHPSEQAVTAITE